MALDRKRSVLRRVVAAGAAAVVAVVLSQPSASAATCKSKYDYIVVGSGAGGGPLSARLAIAGYKVLLIEAGSTYNNAVVSTPALHPLSTEDPNIAWDYFVQHYPAGSPYGNQNVFYPRSSGLGGCTAHNAMFAVYPFESDFDDLASLTGDSSWANSNMRKYFEKMEDNHYALSILGNHGTGGWLPISQPDLRAALTPVDVKLLATIAAFGLSTPVTLFDDINYPGANEKEGWHLPPLSILNGNRTGLIEFLLATKAKYPSNLDIMMDTLVTKVLLDDNNNAYGVQVAKGKSLYHASPLSDKSNALPNLEEIYVNREVILSAGSYNTPQILILSGIGPKSQLSALNITTRIDLPGVGKNLQDRYEVSVNYEMNDDWDITTKCLFLPGNSADPCVLDFLSKGKQAVYGTNGGILGSTRKSFSGGKVDTYLFAVAAPFSGYRTGYSQDLAKYKNQLSFLALKARTNNTNGEVTLASSNPRVRPNINFNYFSDGDGDLKAVLQQVKNMRSLGNFFALKPFLKTELVPGSSVDTDDEIIDHIKKNAWGHHACCTAKIGKDGDKMAVLDSGFRVRGAKNLRVVDASVFPKIPGIFIVTPIYMASEKAADVIIADAKKAGTPCTA
ncbi:hypothetical protein DFJ73DRAFT_953735 [Zopfochytrium polystomum]|nr:hypothetical protein DFJ73DRAFT_953735 [Zopfochytrium polystomum]